MCMPCGELLAAWLGEHQDVWGEPDGGGGQRVIGPGLAPAAPEILMLR
jgi:hypothetical protein